MPDRKHVKCIYKMMLNDMTARPNKINWASLVCNLFNELGFGYAWFAHGVGEINKFMQTFKLRLHDNFIQNWMTRINDSTRALFYRGIISILLLFRKFRVNVRYKTKSIFTQT